jgi:diguanylate cyclase (GGDEF)-like protein
MLDLDHFKSINDNYGHVAGDEVLMDVAAILKGRSAMSIIVARYGGEDLSFCWSRQHWTWHWTLRKRIRSEVEFPASASGTR